MFKTIATTFVLCLMTEHTCSASRILVVSPMPSQSHTMLSDSIVNILLEAGHQVSYVSTFTKMRTGERLTTYNISSVVTHIKDSERLKLMDMVRSPRKAHQVLQVGPSFMKRALQHEATQDLLTDINDSYDAVVAEWFFSGLLAPLAAIYDCPLIWYSAIDASWMSLQLVHEQTSPAYTVDSQARNMALPPFNIVDRISRMLRQMYLNVWLYYVHQNVEVPAYQEIYQPLLQLRNRDLPDYDSLVYNASFLLINSNALVGQTLALPENAKYVGGHHIDLPTQPLPKNLQQLLDDAQNGAILFTLGSHMNSKDLPEKMKREFVEVFGQLEQTVIWKIDERLDGLPKNIHIMDWVPQTSVLNHTNTALLISHGGFLSFIEATYFGVPLIGIPLYGDQFIALDLAQARGRGVRVDFSDDLPYRIKEAINQILSNYSYRSKAEEASSIFKNSLVSPRMEILHHIEMVIKTRGARHLRSPLLHMSTIQRLHLDIPMLLLMLLWFLSKVLKVIQVHLKTSTDDDKKTN